jgi:hypothetical protein
VMEEYKDEAKKAKRRSIVHKSLQRKKPWNKIKIPKVNLIFSHVNTHCLYWTLSL